MKNSEVCLILFAKMFAICIASDETIQSGSPVHITKRQLLNGADFQFQGSLSLSHNQRPSLLSSLLNSARENIHQTIDTFHSIGESVHQALHEGASKLDVPFSGTLNLQIDTQRSQNESPQSIERINYNSNYPDGSVSQHGFHNHQVYSNNEENHIKIDSVNALLAIHNENNAAREDDKSKKSNVDTYLKDGFPVILLKENEVRR